MYTEILALVREFEGTEPDDLSATKAADWHKMSSPAEERVPAPAEERVPAPAEERVPAPADLRCGVQKVQDRMLAEVQGWCRGCRGGVGAVQVVQGGCRGGAGGAGGCRLPAPSAPQQA